jgi:hypothetical protein
VDDEDLRAAMRATMTITPPPPMASATTLAAGHSAVRRRTAGMGAGLIGVLVAATTVAAGVGLHGGGHVPWTTAAAPASATPRHTANPEPTGSPGGAWTKPSWPLGGNGKPQEDATARSGQRYQQGVKLLTALTGSTPPGWSRPTGKTDSGLPLQDHQAQVEGDLSGKTWSYLASIAVRKGDRTGRLLAEVHTPGNGLPTDPCALAQTFWGMRGYCIVDKVGSAKVGLVTQPVNDDRIDQWAAYRYPDGTVVFVAQSRQAANAPSSLRPLTTLPLTPHQLAAQTLDPKFHLS